MEPEAFAKIDDMLKGLRNVLGIREGAEDEDDGGVGVDDDDVTIPTVPQEEAEPEIPYTPITMAIDDPSGNSFLQFH